ncbi:hypothetical protein LCGC14_0950440 [marine sediment metagenome]|uniref:Nuclease associated modular domain-containing protein n=1 Tax=marine sediment metagenome TaxID=412755 RepID=A0A0F9NHI8_9ZZZZ|nr:hypothetical protein [Pricia sp.]
MAKKIKPLPKKTLSWLYFEDNLSSREIGVLLNVSKSTVLKWLRHYEIKTRTTSETSTGRFYSKETRAKMSAAKKGVLHPNWGKKAVNNGGIKTLEKRKLKSRIARAIRGHLKGDGKGGQEWQTLVGYDYRQLTRRLKSTLPPGYEWERDFVKAKGRLHIDHIVPVSAFNFTKPEHEDFKRCWALKNLRLVPAKGI